MTTADLEAIRARLGAAVAAWSEATGDPNDALPQQASAADVPVLLDLVVGLRQELDEARAERDRLLDVYRKAEVFVDATAKAEHMPVGAWAALAAAVDLAARSATPDAEPAPGVPVDTEEGGDA